MSTQLLSTQSKYNRKIVCLKEYINIELLDTQQTFVGLQDVFKTCFEDVFNTSSV